MVSEVLCGLCLKVDWVRRLAEWVRSFYFLGDRKDRFRVAGLTEGVVGVGGIN